MIGYKRDADESSSTQISGMSLRASSEAIQTPEEPPQDSVAWEWLVDRETLPTTNSRLPTSRLIITDSCAGYRKGAAQAKNKPTAAGS